MLIGYINCREESGCHQKFFSPLFFTISKEMGSSHKIPSSISLSFPELIDPLFSEDRDDHCLICGTRKSTGSHGTCVACMYNVQLYLPLLRALRNLGLQYVKGVRVPHDLYYMILSMFFIYDHSSPEISKPSINFSNTLRSATNSLGR
jgi:hypothetical protein